MATIINIFSSPVSWIIVGLALFNIFEWFGTKHTIAKLVEINRPEANIRIGRQANMNITDGCVDDLIKYSKDASKKYTLYINITAVFPLLGILGTVISLMNLSSTDAISANFETALNTTLLGLICAIGFKIGDSWLSADLERALDDADYLIHQHDEEKRIQYATQKETGQRY